MSECAVARSQRVVCWVSDHIPVCLSDIILIFYSNSVFNIHSCMEYV